MRRTWAEQEDPLRSRCVAFIDLISHQPLNETDLIDSVWPLVHLADWVSNVLARTMRDVIHQHSRYEWYDSDDIEERESHSQLSQSVSHSLTGAAIPARILYLVQPSLRALVLRLHTQLHAFVNFVLYLDRPIPYAPAQANVLGGSAPLRDARATVLAKENVRDALGKEGVDLIEWGKAIEMLPAGTPALPPQKLEVRADDITGAIDDGAMTEALLTLSCDPLKASLRTALAALPTPSALFRTSSPLTDSTFDGITLQPLAHDQGRLVHCARCGWKTAVLGDRGWVGMGRWGDWRKSQERLCACGGVWISESKRYPA